MKNDTIPLSKAVEFWEGKFSAIPCIDWLQIDSHGPFQNSTFLKTNKLDYKAPNWNEIYELFKDEWRQATVVSKPTADFISKDTNLFKLENRECYWQKPVSRLIQIAESCNTKFYQPSRIDLAIDFNTFHNSYLPNTFISDYFLCKIVNKRNSGFTTIGNQSFNLSFDYLRFSKKKSRVSVYLYNKSKELREVKMKNYIVKHWKDNGLDINKDIWRLEFSIHLPKFDFIDLLSGEVEQFNCINLDNKDYLHKIIKILLQRYFTFVYKTNSELKNCKKEVKLFSNITGSYKLNFRDCCQDNGRSDRIFLHKLKDLNNELRRNAKHLAPYGDMITNYYKKSRLL
jgi:hypothetical protein